MSETLRASEDEADVAKRCLSKVPEIRRVGWVAFPPAPQTVVASCVFGLVLRRAAQTPYRIGRLSATLASHE